MLEKVNCGDSHARFLLPGTGGADVTRRVGLLDPSSSRGLRFPTFLRALPFPPPWSINFSLTDNNGAFWLRLIVHDTMLLELPTDITLLSELIWVMSRNGPSISSLRLHYSGTDLDNLSTVNEN